MSAVACRRMDDKMRTEEMMRNYVVSLAAALTLSVAASSPLAPALASERDIRSGIETLVGAWKPAQADAPGWALIVFDRGGRFSMLAARAPHALTSRYGEKFPSLPAAPADPEKCGMSAAICSSTETLYGSWTLGIDGGEVVLAFDGWEPTHPSWTRYLQLLLVGDELRPYPGTRGRSPIASTSWLRIQKGFGRRFGM